MTVADDLQKALAFQDTIKAKKWQFFNDVFDTFWARQDFLGAVSSLKRENITPAKLRELLPEEKQRLEEDPSNFYKRKFKNFQAGDFKPSAREKIDQKMAKMAELADFWEVYESQLDKRGVFDFDDQIGWVVAALQSNPDLQADLAEQFHFILVDEYQDTNSSQNAILWALTDLIEDPNILAVGDDDQSIYRFQGASIQNIFDFQARFQNLTTVTLQKNYRSAQNILDAAFASVAKNLERIDPDKSLTAAGDNQEFPGDIWQFEFGSFYSETNFLIRQIKEELKNGINPNEIAILVRKNSEVKILATQLQKFGIPVSTQIFENIFDDEYVRTLILMLRIFDEPQRDDLIFEILHSEFWEISAEKILALSLEFSRVKDKTKLEFLLDKAESDEQIAEFVKFFAEIRKNFSHCRPLVLAEKIFYESKFADFLAEKNLLPEFAKIRKLFDFIREQNCETITEFLENLDLYEKLEIAVRPDEMPVDRRAINILTAHGSKGREFDVVFIPGLEDKKWGNTRSMQRIPLPQIFTSDHDENEDERRLFFVSLTRARQKVFMSYAKKDIADREKNPSMFWHEIPSELIKTAPTDEIEEESQKLLPAFLIGKKDFLLTDGEKAILQEKVKNFVWSASSLQNYLDCPRRFLFQNLYKYPRRPNLAMALGTALHEALEKFIRAKQFDNLSLLESEFERALRGQNLELDEFKKLLAHGTEILQTYFAARRDTFSGNVDLEFDFGKYKPSVEGIRITGKMDKIEFLDEKKTMVKIVDYKSGKPKGAPKGSRLLRQMVFYDILAKQARPQWQVAEHVLEFLTPEQNGEIKNTVVKVNDDARETVLEELKKANEQLLNLEFPIIPNPTNDADIEFWQGFGK